MKNLDSLVFENEPERKTLENLLDTLDHIKPVYVSRVDYNAKRGNILQKTGKSDEQGEFYNLYLPYYLRVGELAGIIRRVNRLTFGNGEPPIYSSSKELQVKIILTYNFLLERLKNETKPQNVDQIKRALKKYYLLYADLFPGKENNLNDSEYRETVLMELFKQENRTSLEKHREYAVKLSKLRAKVSLQELLDDVEGNFSKELTTHFSESFFEKGVNDLRYGLEILSKAENDAIIAFCEDPKNGFKKEIFEGGRILYKKGTDVTITINNPNPEKEAKKLRDKIGVDRLKSELERVRRTGNRYQIAQMELNAANIVAREIHNGVNYYLDNDRYGYQINKILKMKHAHCVGYSIIGHAIFSELGIEHRGLEIPRHSALKVIIGGKDYIYDATGFSSLKEIEKYGKNTGVYRKVYLREYSYYSIVEGDPEKILLSQIYNQKGFTLNDSICEEAIEMYNKAIELNPKYSDPYNNKGGALYYLGRKKEAREMYDIATELNPSNPDPYKNKGILFRSMGKYKLHNLYAFTSELLDGKDSDFDVLYRKEKAKIREFVKKENFEGLRIYLLELEKGS